MAESKAFGRGLPISTKHSVEICAFIRNKPVKQAIKQLELVLKKELAVPFKKFNFDRGHKKGRIAAGAYPQKATKDILDLLHNLEANAANQGMNVNSLVITKATASKASRPWHYGRMRRIRARRTHIILEAHESSVKSNKGETKS